MIEPARKLAAKIPDVHTTYWTSKLLSKIKSEQESEVNYISRFLTAVLLYRNFYGASSWRFTGCTAYWMLGITKKYLGVQQTNWNIRKKDAEAFSSE